MFKRVLALALACAVVAPAMTYAGKPANAQLVEYNSPMMPPADYKGQWWTTPNNCQYSRAGRPGETVWYLIANTAHGQCPVRLIQRAYSDYN